MHVPWRTPFHFGYLFSQGGIYTPVSWDGYPLTEGRVPLSRGTTDGPPILGGTGDPFRVGRVGLLYEGRISRFRVSATPLSEALVARATPIPRDGYPLLRDSYPSADRPVRLFRVTGARVSREGYPFPAGGVPIFRGAGTPFKRGGHPFPRDEHHFPLDGPPLFPRDGHLLFRGTAPPFPSDGYVITEGRIPVSRGTGTLF